MVARNVNGKSRQSEPSNAALVEPPLPFGWKRQFNLSLDRYTYVNNFSKQSSLSRPDEDPYFLEECVTVLLHPREIQHLRSIYDEVSGEGLCMVCMSCCQVEMTLGVSLIQPGNASFRSYHVGALH